ncbi:hypothetical protein BJV78DRAFT_1158538 [Lactifluus subvellereus]|nr:hypothetical protein BJV78DRAFT_1158538 [Lactifluus subvellereus]
MQDSAMNFMSKIQRITDEAFPSRVPPDISIDGGLALFCPACPQIDINIPPETEWKLEDRLLYRPQLVVDGNMKLVHLIMKCPLDDVSLSDGELFMVRRPAYANHLAHAPERQPERGRVHVQDMVPLSHIASLISKRESGHDQALIIYDICCQWSIHFQERVAQSEFLELWDSLKITGAVGKWHLATHIPECFAKFTLNFIEGAGQVEGEILETLWSGMDEVAGLVQAMSTAHHQEVLDEYMNDSNWRKIIWMVPTLADICLRLSEADIRHKNLSGAVSALMEGLAIERSQLLLQRHLMDFDPDGSDDALESHPNGWFTPERDRITLPSALGPGEIEHLSLESIAMVEAELRKGQVTDALEGLRLALGEKSLCFRTEVRNADSQRMTARAWDNVHKLDAEAQKCRATYRHARSALQHLPTDLEYLATLQEITDEDLKLAGDITDKRRFGQQSDALPWFWRIGDINTSNGPRMQEFYRVSWLRAKARISCWSEEFWLVGLEMEWTVNWFRWKENKWRKRLGNIEDGEWPPGLDCYCHKQMVLWGSLAEQAETKFSSLLDWPLFS